jgi:hypothetical protein
MYATKSLHKNHTRSNNTLLAVTFSNNKLLGDMVKNKGERGRYSRMKRFLGEGKRKIRGWIVAFAVMAVVAREVLSFILL